MTAAHDIIQMFGSVEDDQRYTRLVQLFTDDAVYCDPFAGPQRGRDAIASFMGEMERRLPKMGVYFANWETMAETTVGWSRWEMVVPVGGTEYPIAGQSVYRLRDGLVCYASDYVDAAAYARIRPDVFPDHVSAAHEVKGTASSGSALAMVHELWSTDAHVECRALVGADASGTTFSLIDAAGDETVAWAQWKGEEPGGSFAGWSLYTVRNGVLDLRANYYDGEAARRLRQPRAPH